MGAKAPVDLKPDHAQTVAVGAERQAIDQGEVAAFDGGDALQIDVGEVAAALTVARGPDSLIDQLADGASRDHVAGDSRPSLAASAIRRAFSAGCR